MQNMHTRILVADRGGQRDGGPSAIRERERSLLSDIHQIETDKLLECAQYILWHRSHCRVATNLGLGKCRLLHPRCQHRGRITVCLSATATGATTATTVITTTATVRSVATTVAQKTAAAQ